MSPKTLRRKLQKKLKRKKYTRCQCGCGFLVFHLTELEEAWAITARCKRLMYNGCGSPCGELFVVIHVA